MFVSWCYVKAGCSKDTFDPNDNRYAFVPFLVNAAEEGRHNFRVVSNPEPGDLVAYQFDSDSNEDHIGIFEGWSTKGSTFVAIEGNTSLSSDANGGQVMRRTRSKSLVARFIRVDET